MKTEEPTPRRLRKARETGDSPVSHALGQAFALLVAVPLVPAAIAATAARATGMVRQALASPRGDAAVTLPLDVVALSLPILLAVGFTVAIVSLVQTGGVVAGARLAPRLERLDPVAGLGALFRAERVVGLLRSLVTAAAVGALCYVTLRDHAADLVNAVGNPDAISPLIAALGKQLGVEAALLALVLAALDVALQGRAFRKRHRMTKDEVRREHREAEGDPEIKARRRRAHQEALAGAIVNAVKDATVVVVNPTHIANALRYVEGEDEAPKLVASGHGDLARRIVEAAHAYGVPCVVDVPVARALAELEVGEEIPAALYEAVAEILREVAATANRA